LRQNVSADEEAKKEVGDRLEWTSEHHLANAAEQQQTPGRGNRGQGFESEGPNSEPQGPKEDYPNGKEERQAAE